MQTGLDIFESKWPATLKGARAGLLMHPASVNSSLDHAVDCFMKSEIIKLKTLFGPQHGISGETQDNMVEWEGFKDQKTGFTVHSLYGQTRKPEPSMLTDIDVMVIDLQDVGSRYYTFIWTMELCMQACNEAGISIVILDRPNPLGGIMTEGPVLEMDYVSFVGRQPLPVRHGMTNGEIGYYLKQEFFNDLDFHVIPVNGWERSRWFDQTGLPWVLPSPNMPTLDTAMVYPGMCLLEGTNLSEGRGTTRPFEIFGAPFISPEILVENLKKAELSGVIFRPMYFKPTFQKHADKLCGGAQIHITDREKYKPFKTGVAIIKVIFELYNEHFKWKEPPYEYETEKLPVDILAGTDKLRAYIEEGRSLKQMEDWWEAQCIEFDSEVRKQYLLYE